MVVEPTYLPPILPDDGSAANAAITQTYREPIQTL